MYFRQYTFLLLALLMATMCTTIAAAQHTHLNKHLKDSLRTEIEIMFTNDQKYRWMLSFGELDTQKVAAWRVKSDSAKVERMKLVMKHKAGADPAKLDSVARLQDHIDSANFYTLMAIIKNYGFPHRYIAAYKVSIILQHAADGLKDDNFFKILKDEVLDGHMPAGEYANLYDKVQLDQRLPPLYHVIQYYDKQHDQNPYGTPIDLDKTNKAREEIGIPKFKVGK